MKKLSIICCLFVSALISCEKKDNSIAKEKYFDPQNIDLLALTNILFVNRWNAIIEVFYYHVNYEEVEDVIYAAATEIMQRVDSLSTEID